jgi:P-type Ca2+ transporter type 2C
MGAQVAQASEGLPSAEAEQRLRTFGPNEIAARDRRNFVRVLLEALREPLLLLLIGTTAFYLVIGDLYEGLLLAVLTLVDLGIVIYQDLKTERVLESLRELASPRALVIRDGVQRRIPGREVVPGDVVIVSEGDRVPADAELLSAHELKADESLLTGESVPVRKAAATTEMRGPVHPGGDDTPLIFSGSLIVHGGGVARVKATGGNTEIGRIGVSLSQMNFEETRLRRGTRTLARDLGILAAVVSALVIVLQGMRAGDWLGAILAGATTAMSLLPEEIPIVLTVFLTLGAWRISRRNVLTRQVAAIENLGSATILCTDKTGTLTLNRMAVTKLHAKGETIDLQPQTKLSEAVTLVLATAAQASEIMPTDPMERAFHTAAGDHGLPLPAAPMRIYGLSPELLAVTFVRRDAASTRCDVAAKGAPEAILSLCSLDEREQQAVLEKTGMMAAEGLRVLAVAAAVHDGPLPEAPRGFAFTFLGLVGLSDPVRATVPAAVAECREAGIRVIMITGDYPATARAIARQAGIDGSGEIITGQRLNDLSDEALAKILPTTNIFARVLPQQKLRIVSALKALNQVVAMTGDGVNDAPALKAANIGIAMGGRGADVAREAAALVLLDDAFESIVAAIRMGRRIFDNLRKALSYILAVHVPIAGLALVPLLLGWPIVFFPVHIVFLELIIDPACSIAFEAEPEEPDIMRRGPRKASASLFDGRDIIVGVAQGAIGLVGLLAAYGFAIARDVPEDEARAIAFAGLVAVNIALILANRSRWESLWGSLARHNPFLWWVVGAATVVLLLTIYAAPISALFRFSALTAMQFALALAPAAFMLVGTEILKSLRRRAYSLRSSREPSPFP